MRGSDPMTASFADLYARAADRKGGVRVLEGLLPVPKTPDALAAIPDDRWLAEMTRRVFQAGFNWSVVDAKWPGFEVAFDGFDVNRCRSEGRRGGKEGVMTCKTWGA